MSNVDPVPQDIIEETFIWRDWFEKLRAAVQAGGGDSNAKVISYVVPTSGAVLQFPNDTDVLIVNPSGTLTSLTVVLPTLPDDGQEIEFVTSHVITTLTVQGASGQVVENPPTTLQLLATTVNAISGYGFKMIYVAANRTWFRSEDLVSGPAQTGVTALSMTHANGFDGIFTSTTTPALTITTDVVGLVKGNGTAISAASSGTDYAPATSGAALLYGNGAGGFSNAAIGAGLTFSGGTLNSVALTTTGTGSTYVLSAGPTVSNPIFTGTTTNAALVATGTTTLATSLTGIATLTAGVVGAKAENTLVVATATNQSGGTVSATTLTASAAASFGDTLIVTGQTNATHADAVELSFFSSAAYVFGCSRSGATPTPIDLKIWGSNLTFGNNSTTYATSDTSGNWVFTGTVKCSTANGYTASDNSAGITTTITTASLVGKTITVKDGLIVGFA